MIRYIALQKLIIYFKDDLKNDIKINFYLYISNGCSS